MARKLALVLAGFALLVAGLWFAVGPGDESRGAALDEARGSNAERDRAAPAAPDALTTALATQDEVVATRATVADAAAQPSEPPAVVVFGRVVDQRRFAASGAQVVLAIETVEVARAVTNERGEFELALAMRPPRDVTALVTAVRGDDECARAVTSIRGDEPALEARFAWRRPELRPRVDVWVLTLASAHALEVLVTSDGRPAANAEVRLKSSYVTPLDVAVRTDEAGVARCSRVPEGYVRILASAGDRQGRSSAFVPEETRATVELLPPFAATIVVVDSQTQAPIAGAQVRLARDVRVPSSSGGSLRGMVGDSYSSEAIGTVIETDAEGRARVEGLATRDVHRLQVHAVDHASYPPDGYGGEHVTAERASLRIELAPLSLRVVRWPVVDGEVPAPSEGTELRARPEPGSRSSGPEDEDLSRGVVRAGNVEVERVSGYASLILETPEGALARAWIGKDEDVGKPLSFRKPRTIEVLVRDADGAPVAGATAEPRNQGNNSLHEPLLTDESGTARLTGLYGQLVDVHVRRNPTSRDVLAGSVDLELGDGHIECVLGSDARARMRVTIDGRLALPPEYRFWADGFAPVVEELPERGEVVLEVPRPATPGPIRLSLQAPGFLTATTELTLPDDGTEATASLALTRALTLLVRVAAPEKERFAIKLESWSAETSKWSFVSPYFNGLMIPNAPQGAFRFHGLAPGRYHALDELSGAVSDEVEVVAGALEPSLDLDLAGIEWVTGLVEVPDPAELARTRVLVEVDGAPKPVPTIIERFAKGPASPGKDGTFKVRVKRGKTTVLRAWHPWLAAANTVTLDAGREGVLLKLAAGDELRIPAPQLAEVKRFAAARVWLYDGPAEGAPKLKLEAPLVDGALRCGGAPPGTWTLWIDPGEGLAPLVLDDVELKSGVTELPAAAFTRGTTLRLRLHVPEGASPPRLYVSAQRIGEPSYWRQLNSKGEAVVELPGLGPGSFKVHHGSVMGAGYSGDRTIECDGVHDIELDVD